MRRITWLLLTSLVASLILVSVTAAEYVRLPLPAVVVISLGVPTVVLLWHHRRELSRRLGRGKR